MDNTFETQCHECGAVFDCPFESIGQQAECPSCSAVIELVPKVEFKENKPSSPISGSKGGLIIGAVALVLIAVGAFVFLSGKGNPQGSSENNSSSNVGAEQAVTAKIEDSSPFKPSIDYESFKTEVLKYNCGGDPVTLAFKVHENLVVIETIGAVNKARFFRLQIPTKYGYRVTYGRPSFSNTSYSFIEVNSGPSDLPPMQVSRKLERELINLSGMRLKDKSQIIIDAANPLEKDFRGGFLFDKNKRLILPNITKIKSDEKLVQLDSELVDKLINFKSSLPTENYFFADENTYLRNYKEASLFHSVSEVPFEKSPEVKQYVASDKLGNDGRVRRTLVPISNKVFIVFNTVRAEDYLYIEGKHPVSKIADYSSAFLNFALYRSTSGFYVEKFYKLSDKISKIQKLHLAYFQQDEMKSEEVKVLSLYSQVTPNENKVNQNYDPRGKRDGEAFAFYDVGRFNAPVTSTLVASSGERLVAVRNRNDLVCLTPHMVSFIKSKMNVQGTSRPSAPSTEINYKFQSHQEEILSSIDGLTIVGNNIIDWQTKKTYKTKYNILSVSRQPGGDYLSFQYDMSGKKLYAASVKTGKVFKTLNIEIHSISAIFRRWSVYVA